jgi:hypothetical protein
MDRKKKKQFISEHCLFKHHYLQWNMLHQVIPYWLNSFFYSIKVGDVFWNFFFVMICKKKKELQTMKNV